MAYICSLWNISFYSIWLRHSYFVNTSDIKIYILLNFILLHLKAIYYWIFPLLECILTNNLCNWHSTDWTGLCLIVALPVESVLTGSCYCLQERRKILPTVLKTVTRVLVLLPSRSTPDSGPTVDGRAFWQHICLTSIWSPPCPEMSALSIRKKHK